MFQSQTEVKLQKIEARKAVENIKLIEDIMKQKSEMKIEKIVNKRKGLTKIVNVVLNKSHGSGMNFKSSMKNYRETLGIDWWHN